MSKVKKDAKKEPEPVPEVVVPKTEVGCFTFSDGSSYDGEFENREALKVRHGKGKYLNGPESYSGSWENDNMHGEGEYTFASGRENVLEIVVCSLYSCRGFIHRRLSKWDVSR
jgi:hypothetical protein